MQFFDLGAMSGLSEAFLMNLALLIVLAYLHSLVSSSKLASTSMRRQVMTGIVFATATVACMNMPFEPQPGLLLDQRSLILLFAAPFGGPVAALIAGAIAAAYRIYLGGIGMWAGLGGILSTVVLGLVLAKSGNRLQTPGSAAKAGVLLTMAVLPWFLAVDGIATGLILLQKYAVVYPVFYIVGAVALSGILMVDLRRRTSEQQLINSETKLRDVLDVSTDWFWEVDADLRFTFLSQSFRQVFSRDPSAYLGKRRSDLATGADQDRVLEYEDMLRRQSPFVDFTYSLTRADGQTRHVSICGKPFFGPDGEFLGYRGSGREVSEMVEARAGLERALLEAEKANRAKSTFLSQMSHELRTPLNAIIGFADIIRTELRGPVGQEEYKYDAEGIQDSGHHLLGLINDLLDLSKIEAGKFELAKSQNDLCDVVGSAVRMLEPKAKAAGISINTTESEAELPAEFDERALRQVTINLLTNAIKFSPSGSNIRVTLDRLEDGGLSMVVADNGVGIPRSEQRMLFSPFERASHARNKLVEGTGLGLTICKALVEAHDGTISLESAPGEGTTVRVVLPGCEAISETSTMSKAVAA